MAKDTVDLAALIAWLDAFRGYVTENRAYLTELDSAIGDADHFREAIRRAHAEPVIPFTKSRAAVSRHDKDLYKERNRVERQARELGVAHPGLPGAICSRPRRWRKASRGKSSARANPASGRAACRKP